MDYEQLSKALFISLTNWCKQESFSKCCYTMGSNKQGVQETCHYSVVKFFPHLPAGTE